MAASLLKFSQGIIVGGDGRALAVSVGVAVNIANVDNTSVGSWQIDLVDVPSNSSLVVNTLAFSDNSPTPAAVLTPDVSGGCYRIVLKVWSAPNRSGNPDDTDIRNIVVLDSQGFAIPSDQIWPRPLPPTPSGAIGNKPNELNLAGQERGWAGAGNDGLMDQRLRFLGSVAPFGIGAGTQTKTSGTVQFSNQNGVTFGLNNGTLTASIQPGAAAGIGAVAAGTQTQTGGTLSFVNSNGVTFGMSNSSQVTASYSVPSTAGLISAVNISGGTTSNNLSAAVFSNSNNISFGLNGSTVTASASFSQTVQTQSNVQGISAGTQVGRTGDIAFSNSNGISFGMSGSSQITASYTVPSTAGLISAVNASAGTTSQNLSAVVFSNSNNVSFGLNGSTITATATVAQTVQTQNVVVPSAGTQTATSGTVVFSNSNNVSFGMSGSTQITASIPSGATATGNFGALAAGTQTATSGTVAFANSNGITFGMSGSSQITGSYTVPSTAGLISNVNLSAGTTSSSGSAFVFSNSNNVSFGMNGATITATATASQSTAPAAISAGTTQATNGTIVFSNSNGISFGMNAGTITATVNPGAAAGIAAIQGGTQTATSGTVVFSDSNGIAFGLSGSTRMTASYTVPSTAGLISFVNLSAGTTSQNLSALVFSNSNNVSFGLNGSTVTATITVPAQTNQTEGRYAIGNTTGQSSSSTFDARTMSISGAGLISVGYSGNALVISASGAQTVQTQNIVVPSAGTQTATSGTVVFSNSNGISFGMSNSSVITASYTVPTQTNQTVGLFALGNTTQNSSTTLDARSLSFNGLGIITAGFSNGSIQFSATQSAQTQSNVQGISAGTQVGRTSDIIFSNSNGVSFGMSNSSVVTASVATSLTNVNISAGTTSNNLSAFVFSNSNGVSFGLNGSTITGSVAGAAAGIAAAIAGTQTKTSGTLSFADSNGVTFGLSGSNTLTASVAAQTNQTVGLYALGNTTQNSSTTLDARTLSFNGLGGMTAGFSNGSIQLSAPATSSLSATGAVSISVNGNTISIGAAVNFSAGTTSSGLDSVVFSNSNGVSFGLNGSTITASVAGASAGIAAVIAGTQTKTSGTLSFANSNGVTFGLSGSNTLTASVATSLTNINFSAGTTSNNLSALVFSNSNNVSFGLNGSTVTATITVPAQTNQTLGLFATSNTTQNSSSTLDARSVTFQGAGIASVGFSGGSVIISVPNGAPSPVNFSAGTTSNNLGSVVFSNSNGVSFGLNGSTITASAAGGGGGGTLNMFALGNTTQSSSTTIGTGSISFNGLGAMSVGFSNGSIQMSAPATSSLSATGAVSLSTNGSTISIGVSNLGTLYRYEPYPINDTGTSLFTLATVSSGPAYFVPFALPQYVAAGHINIAQSLSFVTNGTSSGRQTLTQSWGLYTRGTGTNSSTLGTITSGSYSIGITGNNSTYTINQPTTSASNSYGTGSTTSAGSSISSAYTGLKLVQLQINSTLSPGNYWLGLFNALSTSSVNVGLSLSYMGVAQYATLTALAPIGSYSSNFSTGTAAALGIGGQWNLGLGSFTSAAQTNLPGSVALSAISWTSIGVLPYLAIVGTA